MDSMRILLRSASLADNSGTTTPPLPGSHSEEKAATVVVAPPDQRHRATRSSSVDDACWRTALPPESSRISRTVARL